MNKFKVNAIKKYQCYYLIANLLYFYRQWENALYFKKALAINDKSVDDDLVQSRIIQTFIINQSYDLAHCFIFQLFKNEQLMNLPDILDLLYVYVLKNLLKSYLLFEVFGQYYNQLDLIYDYQVDWKKER